MKKQIEGRISISRPSCGDGSEFISIRIEDEVARVKFLEVEIGYAEFAQALTGLSNVACSLETRQLDCVGKTVELNDIELILNHKGYGSVPDKVWDEALKDVEVDGWVVSRYLGSKNSIISHGTDDEPMRVRTIAKRWV